MKKLLLACALVGATAGVSTVANAEAIQPQSGTVTFIKGQYQLVNENKRTPLTGLSLQHLRQYEGQQVKVSGELRDNGALEIYKMYRKLDDQFVVAYDWEKLDAELYSN